VYSFLTAWQFSSSSSGADAGRDAECEARLKTVVRQLTREQLGQEMYKYLLKMQGNNNNNNNNNNDNNDDDDDEIEAPHREKITDSEASEAWFRIITTAQKRRQSTAANDDDSVVDHYELFLKWLKNGCDAVDAYYYRSEMHTTARCYLQGAEDAELAISIIKATLSAHGGGSIEKEKEGKDGHNTAAAIDSTPTTTTAPPDTTNQLKRQLAKLYAALGTACLAEKDHPDCSPYKAARAFLLSLDAGTPSALISGKLEEAIGKITREQLEELHEDLYHHERLFDPGALGMISNGESENGNSSGGSKAYRLDVSAMFDCSIIGQCGARARELIRSSLASAAGVKKQHIAFERVAVVARNDSSGEDGMALLVQLSIQIGADKSIGGTFIDTLNTATCSDEEGVINMNMLGGEELVELLGPLLDCSAQLVDCTPKHTLPAYTTTTNTDTSNNNNNSDRQLMQPIRPKMELDLPYRHYHLVRADGSPAPRTDKHPFAMSRVYYDPSEKTTEEVWAEICDDNDNDIAGSGRCCRWTQTGGEVKVIAVNVPSDLPPRHLHVTFQPYSLQVTNRITGEVYLQGTLERGIVPEDCIWTHCGGEGEDGFLMTLKKMNLEVLQKPWAHSEMWWPRLFKHHPCEIAWDDYEKDYSDLPEEVLERHRLGEAVKDDERRVEGVERGRRERLERGDDERKRRRQERLRVLRDGGR
jgi:hypothetical protein